MCLLVYKHFITTSLLATPITYRAHDGQRFANWYCCAFHGFQD